VETQKLKIRAVFLEINRASKIFLLVLKIAIILEITIHKIMICQIRIESEKCLMNGSHNM